MNNNKKYINIAIFTAVAVVLNMLTIPLPFFAEYLRIDLSIVFLFIIAYKYGIRVGAFSVFVVAIISALSGKAPTPFYIGQITYFISFIIFFMAWMAFKKDKEDSIAGDVKVVVFMTVVMVFLNYIIITPIYTIGYGGELPDLKSTEYIVSIIALYLPFNVVQWGLNTFLIRIYLKTNQK